jgi:hypothetical protein
MVHVRKVSSVEYACDMTIYSERNSFDCVTKPNEIARHFTVYTFAHGETGGACALVPFNLWETCRRLTLRACADHHLPSHKDHCATMRAPPRCTMRHHAEEHDTTSNKIT